MKISLIAALAQNRAIGKDNDLLWHLPADMRFFKEKTSGHCILTGRRNYESIPERFRPLPNRTNIVVSRSTGDYPGAHLVHSIQEGFDLAAAQGETECMVIGGGQIYAETLKQADIMYLTRVDATYADADTFFPEWNEAEWDVEVLSEHSADEKHQHGFTIEQWTRKREK